MKQMKCIRVAAAGALLLVWSGGEATAELLIYEPFDYERRQGHAGADIPGEGIQGLDPGGIGWDGGWFKTDSDNLNSGIPEGPGDYGDGEDYGVSLGARTEPLSYSDEHGNRLVSEGNQIRTAFGNRSWERRWLDEPIGELGGTAWLSFMAQAHGDSTGRPRWAFVELASTGQFWVWLGNVTPVESGNWAFQRQTGSGEGEGEDFGDAGDEFPQSVQTMYLAKLEFPTTSTGHTQVRVWLNPPDLTDEDALPEPVFEFDTAYAEYNQIGVAGRFSTDFDEIRVGTTFDSVTPTESVAPPEVVTMDIVHDGGDVVLSWPAAAEGYQLYSSEDLDEWSEVTEEPVVRDERNTVTVPVDGSDRQFFRLQ